MTTLQYIESINQRYRLGNATEHTFRGDLQQLLEELVPEIRATNEPKRQSCGAPDYILTKKDIPVGFIEAKDIGDVDLDGKKKSGHKEQFDRYKASLNNLIFTDYISFHLYHDGEFITKISIAEIEGNSILAKSENFELFENLIKNFCTHVSQTIKSPKKLAEMMAGKARLLSDVIEKSLNSDDENEEDSTLKEQMNAFKNILIHDITPKGFADVYAQTIAYGMFAARLHDATLQTFSRQEAAEKIPKSNPFLRILFGYIAGPDIDDRIRWIVDNLAEIFLACNVDEILKNYGKSTKMEDPIIHFYETFLAEYDPKLRKARGVWYTPAPVVNFIVRAVDDILKNDFDLPQGLSDNSKTNVKIKQFTKATSDRRSNIKEVEVEHEVHKVQILDPATGTGTFLAEVIKLIHKKFRGQEGIWSSYVESHLIPRLNGFEILMASYAMAHLKIDLLLKETGFKTEKTQRTKIYLTNSLEEAHPDTGTLFANWLSSESNEANHVKRDTPVMCVIGNPPYSVSSSNNSPWIENLVQDYKKNLDERNIQPLSDDYIKFIRYGQHFIEKKGSGVLAYISNNSFIDGIIHRQMRKYLLESFDKIYILDLHGNAKKKEISEDGSPDKNVFDIMVGVSINVFVKTGRKKSNELAQVFIADLRGTRESKYDYLNNNNLASISWKVIESFDSKNSFKIQDEELIKEYENDCFSLKSFFHKGANGIKTERDVLTIQFNEEHLHTIKEDLINSEIEDFRTKYNLAQDGRDWKIETAKRDLVQNTSIFSKVHYRPFDYRFSIYTGKSKGFHSYPRHDIHQHLINKDNISLILGRQGQAVGSMPWNLVFINNTLLDSNMFYRGGNMNFPLYLYPKNNGQQSTDNTNNRVPNLNLEIVNKLADYLNLTFTNEKETTKNTFAPIDILDFIYAILHSHTYREKYKEFLKVDFPRVPFPKDENKFWHLVELGKEIRNLHLLESSKVEDYISTYPKDGHNTITTKIGKKDWELHSQENKSGRIWINENQYFDNIPLNAWEFYIGGYHPAQKWLKDRKGRTLEFDDILHYQKIIVALSETDRIMKEVDKIGFE